MTNYKDFKNELLKDPKVKVAYDELALDYKNIQAAIDKRKENNEQKELSKIDNTNQ